MGVRAFKKASLQIPSMQKIINALSVISFLLVVAISGGGVFGYLWITNEENQEKLKKELIQQLKQELIEQLKQELREQLKQELKREIENENKCANFKGNFGL